MPEPTAAKPAAPTPAAASKPAAAPEAASPPGRLGGFFSDLFDLQFTNLLTTRMMPGVYGLGIALAALFTAYLTYRGFRNSVWEGVAWLVLLGPATFIGLVTALRITLEFVLAVFRVAWHVEHVAGSTQELSHHMPKFGFWRTLLWGARDAPPLPPRTDPAKPKQL